MTHICVGKFTIIGSDNGLSPGRRQAIIWTNAGILLIEPLGTNFSEILIGIQIFSFAKMRLKMSSAKWRLLCPGLNVLILESPLQMSWMCCYVFIDFLIWRCEIIKQLKCIGLHYIFLQNVLNKYRCIFPNVDATSVLHTNRYLCKWYYFTLSYLAIWHQDGGLKFNYLWKGLCQ